MQDYLSLRTVHLEHPPIKDREASNCMPRWETETWTSMLEQILLNDFQDYQIDIAIEVRSYNTIAKATIIFATVEDATLFKMQYL